jgi:hypothetical protein
MMYQRLPDGWDTYWELRIDNKYGLRKACDTMIEMGFKEFEDQTYFTIRQLEMYTQYTIVCECLPCLDNRLEDEHKNRPHVILPASHYNEREPGRRYGHPY